MSRAVLAVALAFSLGAAASTSAAPTKPSHLRAYDKHLLKYVNHARVNHGLKPLRQSNRLYKVAHAWAAHMAETETAGDDLTWTSGGQYKRVCPKATAAGANDGWQSNTSAREMFQRYKAEPYHWANILSPKYNPPGQAAYADVGIATVKAKDGSEWNSMYFANHCR
jgi:uncharacterized protein YkwD